MIAILRLGIGLMLLSGFSADEQAGPSAPPRIAAFLDAVRSGDPKVMLKFIESEFDAESLKARPAGPRAERLARLGGDHPGLAFVRMLQEGPQEQRWLARDAGNRELEVTFDLAETPPHRIVGVGVQMKASHGGDDPGPAEKPKESDAEVAKAARPWLDELAARDEFSGSVLIARDGKPFFEGAWGMADRERKIPNRPDTSFNIASIGKLFTKIAIGQLAARGKLALTDTVASRLPGLAIPSADKMTIQQLVSHTSGLGHMFGDKYDAAPKASLRRLSDYTPFVTGEPLAFEPGKGNAYSNAGYVVLGLIVEKVSGMEFHEYLAENVFRPAGMDHTGPFDPGASIENRAVGYTRQGAMGGDSSLRPNTPDLPARNSSAGGSRSSAPDFLKLDLALRQNKLLPAEWTAWIFSDQPPGPGQAGKPRGGLGVAGGAPGINAALEIDLDRGYTVVVMANRDPQIAEQIDRRIRQWLPKSAAR